MSVNAGQLLADRDFLTCAGTETWMLFHQQFPMREFCAFEIYDDEQALAQLERNYLAPLLNAAQSSGNGLLMDALLWRAHPDYIDALGYSPADLKRFNQTAVEGTRDIIARWRAASGHAEDAFPILVAADIGPRGDGYRVDAAPSADVAFDYHRKQFEALQGAGCDLICALTMTSASEATGVARAARTLELPVIISPTVETDGRLPDETPLGEFIERVDEATSGAPVYYMVNCAHPSHLEPTLAAAKRQDAKWLSRLKGFRANCSRKSHEELDNSTELDRGNPAELPDELVSMKREYGLRVLGGCCGTDVEHIEHIAKALN